MWNHRLIRMSDGSVILAEVYYEEDNKTPSMYSDQRDTFYCEPGEDVTQAWEEQRAQYESAFTKPVLDEMLFEQETGFAESLKDAMRRGHGDG